MAFLRPCFALRPVETRSAAGNWDTVTFLDALNMATGNYNSGSYQRDEDSDMDGFFTTETCRIRTFPLVNTLSSHLQDAN